MSIGNQLRQAREQRELSLDQASQATHIRLRYLEALEADQYDTLPSVAQLRGFLRAYGEFLKLNTGELVRTLDGDIMAVPASISPPPPAETADLTPTSSEAIFKDLGQKLRSQRELMGLSLGDVERHTHIRMHYVRALEEGDISHLPSPVQGRGMLSNYASFLGLNTEEVLLHFADGLQAGLYDRQEARNKVQSKTRQESTGRLPARPSQLRRLFSMDLFVGGFLIVFLLGFTIWGALRISSYNASKSPSQTAPPVSEILLSTQSGVISATVSVLPTEGALTPLPVVSETAMVSETVPVATTSAPIVYEPTPPTGTEPVQVYIVAQQRAWMRVTVDGKVAFEGRAVPGSAYSFAGNDRIELLTGDAGGLQVYFNQQNLGVLGTFGQVVNRVFTIQGALTATPAVYPTSTPAPTNTATPTPLPSLTPTPTATVPPPHLTPAP